jgi:hypothetical protein
MQAKLRLTSLPQKLAFEMKRNGGITPMFLLQVARWFTKKIFSAVS